MQLANVTVRLGGSVLNTVPKLGVTPAEIIVLQHIHGEGSVVDIRPAGEDKKKRHDQEFNRLAQTYDKKGGGFADQPGSEAKSLMSTLFPGAVKRLPLTLEEAGIAVGEALPEADGPVDEPEADDELTDDTAGAEGASDETTAG